MTIFLFFAYGTAALLGVVLLLSIWTVTANAIYVNIEQKNKVVREAITTGILDLLSPDQAQAERIDSAALKRLILSHRKLISGILAEIVKTHHTITKGELFITLQEYGLEAIAHEVLKDLKSLRKYKRLWACANLPYLAPTTVVYAPLEQTLKDNDSAVCLSAAQALSTLECAESVCAVIANLSEHKAIPWTRIVELMPGFGPRAVPTLIQSLLEPTLTDDERAITLASLGVLRARDAEALIASHLNHKNKHVRIQAAKALGNISAAQSTHALIASLEDSEWEVRVVSANALGKIADPAALRSLYQHLGDPVYWVRYNSGDALSKLGEAGIEQLTQGIECDDAFARDTCRLVLARTKRIPLSENRDRPC